MYYCALSFVLLFFEKTEIVNIHIVYLYYDIRFFITYNGAINISFNSPQNAPISYTLTFNMGQNGLAGKRRMKSASGYNIPFELFLISDAGKIFIEQEPIKFAGHTLAQWIIFYRAGATSA